ncbi:MORN repeat protein, putative [Perkinsus marinus ATCC 50983]|uniref:MORN repeat-containing protein 5 n=1 Tax=Perkinsus marinus (strain ATCC 50983 / TXsc) TaxID=423536 RepID=C5LH13_PERM5|nr:MORN repeat protein, putative [Perkinsus marinus ATCC 50983]EER03984.1 MORN repeat protein, putative [Perkinsus marinus ATCC 50983]|eukprot:XP_002772168.1 MORN repeat protein, putative [Perkinsus marinus ATCC 50983]
MSEGSVKNGWMEGRGKYTFPDGTVYSGTFLNGEFHGEGRLTFPHGGAFIGQWQKGIAVDGEYVFKDGLVFKDEDWGYLCSGDRRFHNEIVNGLRPAGASLITNDPKGPPDMPEGCYDVGDGYFDPVRAVTLSYDGTKVIGTPGEEEIKWITENAMVRFAEDEVRHEDV